MVIGVRVERPTVWLGEYPSFVVPELTSGYAFGALCFLVDFKQHNHGIRQADYTASRTRFGGAGVRTGLLSLGAVTSFPAAGIPAAVNVFRALPVLPDS